MAFFVSFSGCATAVDPPPQLTGGAGTIEELVKRYRQAHQANDVELLRQLAWWEAQRPSSASHRHELEKPMLEIFQMPLSEVKFLPGPPPDPRLGAEVIYYIPGPRRKLDGIIGMVYGKLLLVEEADEGRERRIIDPAYIVMQPDGGGPYYIDILPLVTQDAARAYRTNTKRQYLAAPMEPVPDARKGEKPRRFDAQN